LHDAYHWKQLETWLKYVTASNYVFCLLYTVIRKKILEPYSLLGVRHVFVARQS